MNSTPIDTYAGRCIHGVPYGPFWLCGLCKSQSATISPPQTISVIQTFCGGCAALTSEAARLAEQLENAEAKLAEREDEIERLRKIEEAARLVSEWHDSIGTGPIEELDAELGELHALTHPEAEQ